MSGDNLAILVPVLRRPHRVKPLMDSIKRATPDARVVFITDPGDYEEHCAIAVERTPKTTVLTTGGNYAHKINRGFEHCSERLLFLGADDLEFHPGWLEACVEKLEEGADVVGTQDLCNPAVIRGEHATHFLVMRDYVELLGTIDEAGKILHEGYEHEYVDNELIETAKARGVYAFANDAVVEHLHPLVGKAPTDELYDRMPARMKTGKAVYDKRRHLWQ